MIDADTYINKRNRSSKIKEDWSEILNYISYRLISLSHCNCNKFCESNRCNKYGSESDNDVMTEILNKIGNI